MARKEKQKQKMERRLERRQNRGVIRPEGEDLAGLPAPDGPVFAVLDDEPAEDSAEESEPPTAVES